MQEVQTVDSCLGLAILMGPRSSPQQLTAYMHSLFPHTCSSLFNLISESLVLNMYITAKAISKLKSNYSQGIDNIQNLTIEDM